MKHHSEARCTIIHNKQKNNKISQVWWCTPVIPALRRLRQEDGEFQASLDHRVRPGFKKKVTGGTAGGVAQAIKAPA
jgi:hypothetical protein